MSRDNFISLKRVLPVKDTLADAFEATEHEKGTLLINLASEAGNEKKILVLSNVFHIPNAGRNLISCIKLNAKGLSTVIEDGACKLLSRENSGEQIGF